VGLFWKKILAWLLVCISWPSLSPAGEIRLEFACPPGEKELSRAAKPHLGTHILAWNCSKNRVLRVNISALNGCYGYGHRLLMFGLYSWVCLFLLSLLFLRSEVLHQLWLQGFWWILLHTHTQTCAKAHQHVCIYCI